VLASVTPKNQIVLGKEGIAAEFRRFIAAGPETIDSKLTQTLGDDYAQTLIDGDPEIDLDVVGRFIDATQTVLLTAKGEPLYAPPRRVEITYAPGGERVDERDPVDVAPTVTKELPAIWTGRKVPKAEAVHKYVFKRTMQIRHVDGVTFDFLFGMAKELAEESVLMILGGGEGGKSPLVFHVNGTQYRGFLEGRIDGESYCLLLHLSNMELKPRAVGSRADDEKGESE
jgi:hypothetical protein